jgi:S1-C subfamily serine protease
MASAVKVISIKGELSGHGSGNYFKLRGQRFIMTAAHNINESTAVFVEERNGNRVGATVVFKEQSQDVAILKLDADLVVTKAVPYKVNANPNIVGQTLFYTSNPSELEYILTKAFVSKSRTDTLMLQANAWYGSSGAVVFDKQGKVCGTVTGILVGHGPIVPQGLENYVFVSRVSFLTKDRIQEILGGGKY